jgi:hypothetical protein
MLPRLAHCNLQTAPKFEFSLLHQAVEFERREALRLTGSRTDASQISRSGLPYL